MMRLPIFGITVLKLLSSFAHAEYLVRVENWVAKAPNMEQLDASFLGRYRTFCNQPDFDPLVAWRFFAKRHDETAGKKLARNMEDQLSRALARLQAGLKLEQTIKLKVILFAGCQKTDGTALLGENGEAFVFFDLYTLFNQKRNQDVSDVFIIHELLHGVHYSLRPEFAPMNYANSKDHLFKYLISEGAAMHFAQKLTGAGARESYWGNILSEDQFQAWLKFSRAEKSAFGERILAYLENPKSEGQLLEDLFYVLKFESLETKRAGYLYGAEIVSQFEATNKRGLNFSYAEIEPFIHRYFRAGAADKAIARD